MRSFFISILLALASISVHANTITLQGTEFNSCPYTQASTDYKGDIIVTCTHDAIGIGIAMIGSNVIKKFNSCRYLVTTMYSNGNIHAVCGLPIPNTTSPLPKTKGDGKNLAVYVDENGMWAWVPVPNGV